MSTKQQKKKRREDEGKVFSSPKLEWALLAGVMAVFFAHARHFDFVQDDSFITFRYIKNFVEGNGLVWNIGERVEGYTTFLWTILLTFPAKLGFDLIATSQNLGILFGLATLFFLYRISSSLGGADGTRPVGFTIFSVILLAANTAVAYWTVSGMETSMFMFLLILAVYFYFRERDQEKLFAYTPLVFVLLSFTRPEGMFLFGLTMLFMVGELFFRKDNDRKREVKRIVTWGMMYAVPVGIFMLWRLSYYGWLFPNTYYAKAGISQEYFDAGLEYLETFARNYLFYGALLIIPAYALILRKFARRILFVSYLVIAYTIYIVTVGGDVLPAWRFFVPILPLLYLLVQEGVWEFFHVMHERRSSFKYLSYVVIIVIAYYTYKIPYDYVREYWTRENGLVVKMTELGTWIKQHSTPQTQIAASTIGAVGYYSDVTLIDMLGLTDETIAHEPEKIFGVRSGWRERNYNVTYVLSRKPDYILFSTGIKPSAFAERALFTRDEFRQWYYPYYFHPSGDMNYVDVIYKRSDRPIIAAVDKKSYDNDFINQYYDGMNRSRRAPAEAIQYFQKSLSMAPADFAMLYQELGNAHRAQNNLEEATRYYERAVQIDPRMVESHLMLGYFARQQGKIEEAIEHFEAITRYTPEFAVAWTFLGETLAAQNKILEARAAYQRALQITPNNSDALQGLQRLSKS